jgi:long-chain acyl-CoA synthetase
MYRNVVARAESAGQLGQIQAWQERVRLVKRFTGVNMRPVVFRSVHKALAGRIRFLVSGAAALKLQTALDYYSLGLPLLQGAGVTETADGFAVQRFSRRRFLFTRYYERHVGCVGQALPGVEARLLDVPEKRISVAAGGKGELALRGQSVFLGYWQAPEATEADLVDGWVHTGDLARIDEEGNIYITGRSKYVIVLDSGEKVHPDEVETKLEETELIQDICVTERRVREKAVVTAVVYPNVDAVLARIAGTEGDATAVEKLVVGEVQRLGEKLAAYKRVGRIELTDGPLPKTAVRKVARGRLADSYSFDYEKWLSSRASA